MFRILVTGTSAKIGKTTFIRRLVENLPGFAVIQIKENGFFTSVVSDPQTEEARLLRDSGAVQVIHILAEPNELQDALTHALCLLSSQIQGIIIDKGPPFSDLQADLSILLSDGEANPSDPVFGSSRVIWVHPNPTGPSIKHKWRDTPDIPIFALDPKDMTAVSWREFWNCLKGWMSLQETQ